MTPPAGTRWVHHALGPVGLGLVGGSVLPTLHTVLYLVYELVGLAAVQEGPDGREGVQDDGLGVGLHVVLKNTRRNTLKLNPHASLR